MNRSYAVFSVDFGPSFRQLGESEQVFLVLLMRVLNEVNILSKAVLFASNGLGKARGPIESAQMVTGLFFLRELASKLWEGWQFLQTSYFGAGLSRQYDHLLGPDGRQALGCMKQYFGQQANPLKFVRDKHAFHYDACAVKNELAQRSSDEPLSAFVAEERGNCLFVFAEDIATSSVLRSFHEDEGAAMRKLIEEIAIIVPGWFQEFGAATLIALAQRCEPTAQEQRIGKPPALGKVTFPFFVRRDS